MFHWSEKGGFVKLSVKKNQKLNKQGLRARLNSSLVLGQQPPPPPTTPVPSEPAMCATFVPHWVMCSTFVHLCVLNISVSG